MKERDCANCKHHSEDGCSKWDCEFEAKMPKGELISKADAIELLTEIVFDEPPYFDSETLCRLYAEEQINTLPSADAEWIPCSDRLPEEDKDVLVTVYFKGLEQRHKTGWNDHIKPNHYVEVASQIDGEWHSYSDEYKVARNRHEVVAWMLLPKPYKGAVK